MTVLIVIVIELVHSLDFDDDHDRTQNGIEHSASVQQRRRLTARGGVDSPIPEARS